MPDKHYMRSYMLDRYHERRAKAIAKLGSKCVMCFTTDELEIDHIDPSKKTIDLAKLWSCAEEKFWKELDKCQLLCKPCHKEKSDKELSVGHGMGKTGKRNCYCPLCKPLKQAYNRANRSRWR